MSWLRRPLMSTTNETPHESCSKRGSYSPLFSGRLLKGSLRLSGSKLCLAFVISHPIWEVTFGRRGTTLARAAEAKDSRSRGQNTRRSLLGPAPRSGQVGNPAFDLRTIGR